MKNGQENKSISQQESNAFSMSLSKVAGHCHQNTTTPKTIELRNWRNNSLHDRHDASCIAADTPCSNGASFSSSQFGTVVCSHAKISKIKLIDCCCGITYESVYLTIMQERQSEAIIGYNISYFPPSATSIICCLRHALSFKGGFHTIYPAIENRWPIPPMIHTLVIENDPVFRAQYLENALQKVGIAIQFCANTISQTADRIFYNLNHHISRESIRCQSSLAMATYTPAAFDYLLNKYFVDGFNRGYLLKLDASPIQVYNKVSAQCSKHFDLSQKGFDFALSITQYQKLTHQGIIYQGLIYQSPNLFFEYLKNMNKIEAFKVMPWDMSKIFVETDQGYLSVPAEKFAYTMGLSLDHHRAILKGMRRKWSNEYKRNSNDPGKLDPVPA